MCQATGNTPFNVKTVPGNCGWQNTKIETGSDKIFYLANPGRRVIGLSTMLISAKTRSVISNRTGLVQRFKNRRWSNGEFLGSSEEMGTQFLCNKRTYTKRFIHALKAHTGELYLPPVVLTILKRIEFQCGVPMSAIVPMGFWCILLYGAPFHVVAYRVPSCYA